MGMLDRRQVLAGSGLALALAACDAPALAVERKRGRRGSAAVAAPLTTRGSFEPAWHHGDRNPKNGHPVSYAFDPPYCVLLHLYLNEFFELEAKRVHFVVNRRGSDNDFDDNRDRFKAWINYYNDRGNRPNGYWFKEISDNALEDFAVGHQHHVLIYIRNQNITYDDQWPIWFGKKLTKSVMGVSVARANDTFFDVDEKDVAVLNGSKKGIYMKNFHTVKDGSYRALRREEKFAYSFNINALAKVAGFEDHAVPIIIDPDTGNMGDGIPHHYE